MAERKCGNCRQPGHTKATCLQAHDAELLDGRGTSDIEGRKESLEAWERPTAANVQVPPVSVPEPTVAPMADEADDFLAGAVAQADAFLHGAVSEILGEAPKRKQTGQAGYLIKDPATGDFRRYKNGSVKGITRCTTFVEAAADSYGITQWQKRNVLMGASLRPDIVAKAHGMNQQEHYRELGDLLDALEEAAGANVASNLGTLIHDLTERIDRQEITIDDVPQAYQGHIQSYVDALRAKGLEIVPEMMERVICTSEYGGVAGKFDRVLYHPRSRTYRIGDLKTGKDMKKGWGKIETQEWIYTSGFNQNGIYEWDDDPSGADDAWTDPEFHISEDFGVVMWLPVTGPAAGTCQILQTDLQRGARRAEVCARVREENSNEGAPVLWTDPVIEPKFWDDDFRFVDSVKEAGHLWAEAKADGVPPMELQRLVKLAQDRLRSLGVQG